MSWQRIDENTYIDDTLVTCAEYQLFIDEMHEQGNYYQPDHWTSFQFPAGQARKPILGVRHSDAVAFCEWLTAREGGEWKYRQPTQEEEAQFPMKVMEQSLLGYWLNKKYEFVWIGSLLKDARRINIDVLARTLDLTHDLHRDRDRAKFFNLDLSLNLARDRARELARALDRDRVHVLDPDLGRDRARALIRALYVARGLDRPLDLDRDLSRVVSLTRDSALDLDRVLALTHDLALTINLDRDLSRGLEIYIDLYTLQERIAGRSPAFEGIRLVKERR